MDKSLLIVAPFLILRLIHTNRLSRDEIIRLQNKKLRRLIKHSFEKVPYYNKLFRASGIRPEDIRTVDDLDKIPISKKSNFSDVGLRETVASNIDLRECVLHRTSGTSGIKLEVYRHKRFNLTNLLHLYLWQLEVGDKIRNRHLTIGGCWISPTPFGRMGILPMKRVSPFEDTSMQIKQIIEYDPSVLLSLPSALRVIAKEIIHQQVRVKIPLIFAGGEKLDNHTRQLAQEAFDAEVFEGFGMTEVGTISGECRAHIGQHVWSDNVFVEISRDGERVSSGEKGCITVTGLNGYAMPFIRYNSEDIGMLIDDECVCGLHSPLLRITEGRMSDLILLNDGRQIPAHELCVSLYPIQGIKQFQVIQESVNRFIVKVVKSGCIEGLYENIAQTFEQKIGNVDVEVLIVDDIPRLKSGKFKQFLSKLHQS
jgi:phenylacetate-CoA ligase